MTTFVRWGLGCQLSPLCRILPPHSLPLMSSLKSNLQSPSLHLGSWMKSSSWIELTDISAPSVWWRNFGKCALLWTGTRRWPSSGPPHRHPLTPKPKELCDVIVTWKTARGGSWALHHLHAKWRGTAQWNLHAVKLLPFARCCPTMKRHCLAHNHLLWWNLNTHT